jgi:prevent-host-death family protein
MLREYLAGDSLRFVLRRVTPTDGSDHQLDEQTRNAAKRLRPSTEMAMMAKSKGCAGEMHVVNVAELKNNLSQYLRQVRQGNEITIKDRNRVIARIVPAAPSADYDEELLELAAQGKVKLPEIPPTAEDLAKELKRSLPRIKSHGKKAEEVMKRIWEEERRGH